MNHINKMLDFVDKVNSYSKELHTAVVFWIEPIEQKICSRHILSASKTEVILWAEDRKLFFQQNTVPYKIYVDDDIFDNRNHNVFWEKHKDYPTDF